VEQAFNPYREWLQIPDGRRPPNYYALFGLKLFESDLEAIAQGADSLQASVRRIRPGEYVVQWQALLDEIAAGKTCLTTPQTKAAYDAQLRRTPSMQGGAKSSGSAVEELLRPQGTPPWDVADGSGRSLAKPVPPPAGETGPQPPAPVAVAVPPGSSARALPPGFVPDAGYSGAPPVLGDSPPIIRHVAAPGAWQARPWHEGPVGYLLASIVAIVLGALAYVITRALTV